MESISVSTTASIRDAIAVIDRGGRGIALVVDAQQYLVGAITDGDVRRAMLAGVNLDDPATTILARKAESPYAKPVTALVGTPPNVLLQLMRDSVIRQIPLLDENEHVADLVTLDDLLSTPELPLQAIIMAGGAGMRLRPLTEDLPKPMLPVGGRPLMEHIIGQLQQVGIRQVNVATHYKPEKIKAHFGNGAAFGVEIHYVQEDQPLGTGGALGLLPRPHEPLLVINGDILTQVDFRAMLAYHQEQQAQMTVAVRRYEVQVPYGIIECDGPRVRGLREKPQLSFFVNAGIYLLEPEVYQYIPSGRPFNMTDLIQWLLEAEKIVASFPVREYWLDIGQHADYTQAQEDMRTGRVSP